MINENERFPVPARLEGKTDFDVTSYQLSYTSSISDPETFWSAVGRDVISWFHPWKTLLAWDYSKGEIRWFQGGTLNVSYNCVDRHLSSRADQNAIVWEGNEPGEVRTLTYKELHIAVCKLASVLRAHGVKKGDRVAIYLPMVPEAAVSMLACARIGAIHSVIFAGFSAQSVRDRVLDSAAKVVITANEGLRGSKKVPLKVIVDEALSNTPLVTKVIVFKRTESEVPMMEGRDVWWHDEMGTAVPYADPEIMDAEDPLFILYTSGSTGKPKGVLHTQGGYLVYAAYTHRSVFDYKDGDVYFCAADVGWITGHSYVVYGPLANGATTLMFESVPTYPNAGRYWDVIARHKVNIFYTAPTAIRAVAKEGPELPTQYDLSSLKILGSVGEPINRDAWLWYYFKVGGGKCAVVDTWWQTETGGILISPLPGATITKPGSATKPLPGIQPAVVDEKGVELTGNGVKGYLCMKFPWPGQARTIYGDHERFVKTYFSTVPGMYFTGDGCERDKDGYYWITGRVDDVLNVAGHRLGTAEIESAIIQSGLVAEAAVVEMPHEIKGHGIYAYCILKEGVPSDSNTLEVIKAWVRKIIGSIAVPDKIQFVPGLPKTRSGKIMRRILRKIAEGEDSEFGDISSLADPAVVKEIASGAKLR